MPVNRNHLLAAGSAAADQEADEAPSMAAVPTAVVTAQPKDKHCSACTSPDEHDEWNATARGETPLQRVDRAYAEILQEIRVAQTGVQILFAFLLTLAFTSRFAAITEFQKHVYVLTLMLSAGATALLIAPAAFHRVVYRRRLKQHLVQAANRLALAGLVLLLLALGPALVLAAGALIWFIAWWFIFPVCKRVRHQAHQGLRIAPGPLRRPGPWIADVDRVPAAGGRPAEDGEAGSDMAGAKTAGHALFAGPDAAGVTPLPSK
jgi:hypothetical protein